MIGSLRGTLIHKTPGQVIVEVSGVGYEICVALSAFDRLPQAGQDAQLYVVESMAMYGGGITLYGFLSMEEKEIYLLLREIPGTGSKKALDYLDNLGIVSVGRNAQFEYINMDEAVRRGLEVAEKLDAEPITCARGPESGA